MAVVSMWKWISLCLASLTHDGSFTHKFSCREYLQSLYIRMRAKSMKHCPSLVIEERLLLKKQSAFVKVNAIRILLLFIAFLNMPDIHAQDATANGSVQNLTLPECVDYALKNQPSIRQAMLNVQITKVTNFINISGWLPQVGSTATLAFYPQAPTSLIANPTNPNGPLLAEKSAIAASFIPGINATQAIFSPSLLYSATSAHLYTKAAQLIIDSSKINIAVAVSKSFYNLLLNLQEIDVLKEDTVLLTKSVKDAYNQYMGGIVDKTDYQEATITLNNTVAQLRQANNNVAPLYAILKQYMGYPAKNQFNVSFDTAQMAKDISLDTTQQLQYEKRVEYQQLANARALQHKLTLYNELSFLPSLGAYFNYNYEYESNRFSDLLATAYPNSVIGLSLNLPLFTGLSRIEGVHRAKLEEKLFDWSEQNLQSAIYTQYSQALANYNSNLFNMHAQQDNAAMARNVFQIVELQYRQGIVPYLNVITAQSNLISSEIGYLNSLFQVLSTKIDVEQAMGNIAY